MNRTSYDLQSGPPTKKEAAELFRNYFKKKKVKNPGWFQRKKKK